MVTKLLSIFPSSHWIGWLDYPWRHIMFIKIQVSNLQEQTANMVLVCVGLYSDRLKCCCLFELCQISTNIPGFEVSQLLSKYLSYTSVRNVDMIEQ